MSDVVHIGDKCIPSGRARTVVSEFRAASGGLADGWYAACESKELGDGPLGRTIFGEMLVLFRGKDGAPRCFIDRCLHRNALLSEGDVFDGCIGCPYHGWTYDAEGSLVDIPSEGPGGRRPDEARNLQRFPVSERDGLVWVWMGTNSSPDREPFTMPYHSEPGWGAYYMRTPFSNSVTNLVENFMDVPHTVFVHKGWFRSRSKKRIMTVVERTEDSVLVTYDQPNDSIGFTEKLLNPKKLPMTHTDRFYMPNNTRVDYAFGAEERAFVITSTCTPVSAYETMVYTLISYKLGALNPLGRIFLPFYTRKVIEQDVVIAEIQGRGLKHHGYEDFSSTPADTLHVHIEALRKYAQDGGERPAPVVERMDFWI